MSKIKNYDRINKKILQDQQMRQVYKPDIIGSGIEVLQIQFKKKATLKSNQKGQTEQMPQKLLAQTFTNLLASRQQQHNFNQQQIRHIIQSIIQADRQSKTIEEQLQTIIKELQEKKTQTNQGKQLFMAYELEWVINWLVETYYRHLKLIQAFEAEVEKESVRQKQVNTNSEDRESEEIQLLVDSPAFVQPLVKAKLIRDGSATIMVDGHDIEQPNEKPSTIQQS